jgi:hypothetical protein
MGRSQQADYGSGEGEKAGEPGQDCEEVYCTWINTDSEWFLKK